MYELGVCTWTFGDLPLNEIASRLKSMGFDGVELQGGLSRYSAAEVKQVAADNDLKVFSLTPDDVDLSHPNQSLRREAVDYFLALLDFAAELGGPLISCHGLVGRIVPVTSLDEENKLLYDAVQRIAERAQALNLRIVFEVLNRYESYQVRTCEQALQLVEAVDSDQIGILLDAYHMNIEEADPAEAIRAAGERLWLYHAADSNRKGIGRGHTDFSAQFLALQEIDYRGPIILECNAPGLNPFSAIKAADSIEWLETYLSESRDWLLEN